ncbi:MAG TPA: sigma 54-interacting transcriptional regulator [Polyangiaceae bacterium]|nr:sigma 54-interacting transcriptional regulator [Polyangiaceae bacterium]
MLPVPGQPLRVVRILGGGATSRVLLAERAVGPAGELVSVVVKLGRDKGQRPRFADEAERLCLVDSPWVAPLLDVGALTQDVAVQGERFERGVPFLVFAWEEGQALAERAAALPAAERRELALMVARDMGAALADLHGVGSAHGDIKPQNIVLTSSGARLIDFGLSGEASAEVPSGGTRRYLAPEVLSSGVAGDGRRRDLFALGVVLAELLLPELQSAEQARQRLPERDALADVVRALLQVAPSARPSAAWVAKRAQAAGAAAFSVSAERGQRAVTRAYRFARRRELVDAARASRAELRVGPLATAVLAPVLELLVKIRSLRGQALAGAAELHDLDALGQARFLVALVGVAASSWPRLPLQADDQLLERATRAVQQRLPQALGFLDFEAQAGAEARSVPREPLALSLALREPAVADATVDAAEDVVRAGGAPPALLIELLRVLRLRGELGRALALLVGEEAPEMRVELAELLRRAGELPRALEVLDALGDAPAESKSRAAALRARAELDAGRLDEAARWLAQGAETAQIAECQALLFLRRADYAEARRQAERARLLSRTDEQRARAESLFGMLAHALGQPEAALAAFRASREFAARAGAVLEEATYATGVAAAAASVGDLGEALDAARRSLLLFEHLGRSAEAARAVLSIAAAHAAAGAALEAREAAEEAISRAKASADNRCRAYAHFVLCDVSSNDSEAVEHVKRAASLLDADSDDQLRCAARLLQRGEDVDRVKHDSLARRDDAAIDARLEWWGARAVSVLQRPRGERGDEILAELKGLSRTLSPVGVRGPALFAGARLAAHLGDGATARHFTEAVADAARELLRRAPEELRPAVMALPWLARAQDAQGTALGFTPEQLADVESLVRALGHRERLRPLLDQVLDALVLWTGVERGLLLLRAPNGHLRPRAARNIGKHDLSGVQLELSTSLAERALAEGRPVVAVDAAGDLPEVHESVHALKLRSVLAVPLVARGEPLGVVYLDDRVRRGAFGARELSWVSLVATLAALAIADARDQLLLRRAARRAERASRRLDAELSRREAELDVAERELSRVKDGREVRFSYDAIVGKSEAVRGMLQIVDRVTATEVPVLLLGESGSGKELVARAIHQNGARGKAPFVSENCAAIPEPLLESTLFGHVRGAFTGAQRSRAGLFEVADRGTLFLDEIGEMSLGMQTKLLRALQSGEVRPVGSETVRHVDVRVIGATHRDLNALVAAGKFREDLLYRLNVISVRVPPLRERFGDVSILVQHFLRMHSGGRKLTVERAAMDALSVFPWPGNVRQLENEVRRALVLSDDVIRLEHLSRDIAQAARPHRAQEEFDLRGRVDALEADLVRAALRRTDGNQTRAAELLGLSRFGLQKMMKRLEIRQEGRSDA